MAYKYKGRWLPPPRMDAELEGWREIIEECATCELAKMSGIMDPQRTDDAEDYQRGDVGELLDAMMQCSEALKSAVENLREAFAAKNTRIAELEGALAASEVEGQRIDASRDKEYQRYAEWRRRWYAIAKKNDVSISEREVTAILDAALAALEG